MAKSEAYVIDASVAAKWFLNDEDLVDKADLFLERMLANEIELHAPVLLKHELADALTRAQRNNNRPLDQVQCIEAYQYFSQLPIIFHNTDDNAMLDAVNFAIKYHRRVYDSTYICLAKKLRYRWLTSEKRFSKAALSSDFPREHLLTLESV